MRVVTWQASKQLIIKINQRNDVYKIESVHASCPKIGEEKPPRGNFAGLTASKEARNRIKVNEARAA